MSESSRHIPQFARLLESFVPHCRLCLYAAGGRLIWLSDDTPGVPDSLDLSGWQKSDGHCWWHEGTQVRVAWPISDEQGRVSNFLVVQSSEYPYQDLVNRVAPVLEAAAESIGREQYMNQQLDAMARELAVRYEELNLVYHTDDEVRHLDEGQRALITLVQNCNDYLDVDITALVMPDQGVNVMADRDSNGAIDGNLMPLLQKNLVESLRRMPKTLVLNDPQQTLKLFGLCGKLIASPVHDGNGQVAGALIIIRMGQATDFANSDRNLLMVMSGKAAKIIQSSYDSLTGLMRQDGFQRGLASALARARESKSQNALLHLNIDRLHLINDTLGYQAGDNVIQAVGALLRDQLRESDCIARLGSDEFGILVRKCGQKQAELVAEKLCTAIEKMKVDCDGRMVEVTACVGIASLNSKSESTINVQAGAEIACSVAKERGRNRWHVYDKDDPTLASRQGHMEWVERLKRALHEDQFLVYSQRIVPLRESMRGYHFEILVRLADEDGGLVPPGLFLPVAERYQMMPAIDRWVVARTLTNIAELADVMQEEHISCAINLSGQTMMELDFVKFAREQFDVSGVPPELICFEITETAAIANLKDATRLMNGLREMGCRFALDDFGAGLSSFAYLRSLPVDYLKLDGSFVKPITTDRTAAAMLAAMNQIGQIIGLETIAEFVENDEIMECLREMGVDYAQGYGVGRPRPLAEEIEAMRMMAAIPA